jgi:hypothetical protein
VRFSGGTSTDRLSDATITFRFSGGIIAVRVAGVGPITGGAAVVPTLGSQSARDVLLRICG